LRIKELFTVPEGTKVTERIFTKVLLSSVCSILLCMVCLVSTTWAWFTVSIENQGNEIKIAEPEVKLQVNGETFKSGNQLRSGEHKILIKHANELDDLQKKSTLYVTFYMDDETIGYVKLAEEDGLTAYTAANQDQRYSLELTFKVERAGKLSWEVSWLRPNNVKALTDSVITVPSVSTMAERSIHISFDDVERCFNNLKTKKTRKPTRFLCFLTFLLNQRIRRNRNK
jgi:hypothetical protein